MSEINWNSNETQLQVASGEFLLVLLIVCILRHMIIEKKSFFKLKFKIKVQNTDKNIDSAMA